MARYIWVHMLVTTRGSTQHNSNATDLFVVGNDYLMPKPLAHAFIDDLKVAISKADYVAQQLAIINADKLDAVVTPIDRLEKAINGRIGDVFGNHINELINAKVNSIVKDKSFETQVIEQVELQVAQLVAIEVGRRVKLAIEHPEHTIEK